MGELISSYSRSRAIEDGVLIDLSRNFADLTKNAGFKIPVACTDHLWQTIQEGLTAVGQDLNGRIWDVLYMAVRAFKNFKEDKHLVPFEVLMKNTEGHLKLLCLWLVFNEAEGFTIMHPEDY